VDTNQTRTAEVVAKVVGDITDAVLIVKPEVQRAGIAVVIREGVPVAFAGDGAGPAAVVEVTNATMPHAVTLALTERLTTILGSAYSIPPTRLYVFFHEIAQPHLVGLLGKTFTEIFGTSDT